MGTEEAMQIEQPVKAEDFLPFEVTMTYRTFKQVMGGMAAVALQDESPCIINVSSKGIHSQMAAVDSFTILDAQMPPDAFKSFVYDESKMPPHLQFGIRAKYMSPLIKRMKKDDEILMKINRDSQCVLSFNNKLYRLPMVDGGDNLKSSKAQPSAKVMTTFPEWKEVLEDMIVDGDSSYATMIVKLEVVEGGKVSVKQVTRNPDKTLYESLKTDKWSGTGQGETEVKLEMVKLSKDLIGDNVMLEFGTQEVETKDPLTNEKKIEKIRTPLVITFDEGYMKFVIATLIPQAN